MGTSAGGIAKTEFELTPYSGDHFLGVADLVKKGNVTALVDGAGMIYTSEGHNLAVQVPTSRLNAFADAQLGTSMCMMPSISGTELLIPPGDLYISGEYIKLYGPESDGSQKINLAGLTAGAYALVIETWNALVGVTTYGRATVPSYWAGAVSSENKPTSTAIYRSGNLQATDNLSDDPVITGTLETQRMIQKQYVLRLIPDATLVGSYATSAAALDRAGTLYMGDGDVLTALSPYSSMSTSVAVDRTFTTCKLALVRIESATSSLLVNAPHMHLSVSGLGQSPIPIIPSARRFQGFVTCEIERLDVADALLADRITTLEKLSDSLRLTAGPQAIQSGTDQRIFYTTEESDKLGWHDNTTVSQRQVMDFTGTVMVICHTQFEAHGEAGTLDGTRGLALYINGADSGIRVNTVAAGNTAMGVQLTCEVSVNPGDILEIAAPHTSTKTDLSITSSRLTLRRTS